MMLERAVALLKRFVTVSLVALIFVVATGRAEQAPPPQTTAQTTTVGDASGGYTGFPLSGQPQVFKSGATSYRVVPTKGLVRPWALAFLPNGDILITERGGRLRLVHNGVLDPQEIAGIPPVLHHRAFGLMDVALHPRFADNHLVYFTYSKPKAGETDVASAVLLRARYDGGHTLSNVQDLFVSNAFTDQASQARIVFGRDGKIYMSIGMTHPGKFGSAQDAQDPASHGGKVLRLNDDGSAPLDNPFAGRQGYKPELYAFGIRNAIGLIVHPQTGELWDTENGPFGGDEINIIQAGKNYGWPVISYGRSYSGERTGGTGPTLAEPCAPGMEQPFLFWNPSIAVAGIAIYTGDRFPQWKGHIFVGAMRGNHLERVTMDAKGLPQRPWEPMLTELKQRIREVRQGPDGLLYLLTDEDAGALLRIEPA
jgi:glucose/arabinose dehydrogenase